MGQLTLEPGREALELPGTQEVAAAVLPAVAAAGQVLQLRRRVQRVLAALHLVQQEVLRGRQVLVETARKAPQDMCPAQEAAEVPLTLLAQDTPEETAL
jgi:hypothetical protein